MALRNRATVVHTFGRVPILEVSTTSFDHWRDQQRCLAECARVLEAKGGLVLADFVLALARGDAHRRSPEEGQNARAPNPLLTRAGCGSADWHPLKTPLIAAFGASKL